MGRVLRGKDGRFAGSTGSGADRVPTSAPHVPPAPGFTRGVSFDDMYGEEIAALTARFGNRPPAASPAPAVSLSGAPIAFNTVIHVPAADLHDVYTEYYATVGQLDEQDLDDYTRGGGYDWAALAADIRANGVREPLEIAVDPGDGTLSMINGSHRALIARNLKLTSVPVIYRAG
jgi:hypothetical protein